MVAREVFPDFGSRNRKHQDLVPLQVTRKERPVDFKSAISKRRKAGGETFRMKVSVNAFCMHGSWASILIPKPSSGDTLGTQMGQAIGGRSRTLAARKAYRQPSTASSADPPTSAGIHVT